MTSTGDLQSEEPNAQNAASTLSRTGGVPEGCHLEAPSTSDVHQTSPESVEMADLRSMGTAPTQLVPPSDSHNPATPQGWQEKPPNDTILPPTNSDPQPSVSSPEDISHTANPPILMREQTAPAIGPATDMPSPVPRMAELTGSQLMITLLLTTGARHPYKIDEKYLKKRNVNVVDNNPVNMSVYTLKELIWRDWREGQYSCVTIAWTTFCLTSILDWEARPSSPSSIRLIHYGKMLDDKAHLKGLFSL